MKCPKCGYIGFEAAERCRNCGYDFSLTIERIPTPELPLAKGEATGPLADLPLGPRADGDSVPKGLPAFVETPAGRESAEGRLGAPGPAMAPGPDLPLFASGHESDDDRPLITPSATPRPPLAVRRTTPPATRQHARTSRFYPPPGGLNLEPQADTGEKAPERPADAVPAATAGRRVVAAAIDLLILGGLDAGVLYFTLRLCRLTAVEAFILPAAPLLLFFLILDGGYLLAFTTAGGQTIGKMAVGIKVVTADADRLTLRQAAVRTIGCILCVAPAGLGFVPFLLMPGRRALHDRLARTWVVNVLTP
jgi:uncharacterized RDD family membrane protein YckC